MESKSRAKILTISSHIIQKEAEPTGESAACCQLALASMQRNVIAGCIKFLTNFANIIFIEILGAIWISTDKYLRLMSLQFNR
jgi:hypothetical protein